MTFPRCKVFYKRSHGSAYQLLFEFTDIDDTIGRFHPTDVYLEGSSLAKRHLWLKPTVFIAELLATFDPMGNNYGGANVRDWDRHVGYYEDWLSTQLTYEARVSIRGYDEDVDGTKDDYRIQKGKNAIEKQGFNCEADCQNLNTKMRLHIHARFADLAGKYHDETIPYLLKRSTYAHTKTADEAEQTNDAKLTRLLKQIETLKGVISDLRDQVTAIEDKSIRKTVEDLAIIPDDVKTQVLAGIDNGNIERQTLFTF